MTDQRQRLLERLARIQRSISVGAPLQEVLDAITAGAHELLGDEAVGLRLRDTADPDRLTIASSVGPSSAQSAQLREAPVGEGAGGRAIAEDRLVVVEDYGAAAGTIGTLAEEGL